MRQQFHGCVVFLPAFPCPVECLTAHCFAAVTINIYHPNSEFMFRISLHSRVKHSMKQLITEIVTLPCIAMFHLFP